MYRHHYIFAALFLLFTKAAAAELQVIVVFHNEISPQQRELIGAHGGVVLHEYEIIPGLVVTLPESALARLEEHPEVAYIEENRTVTAIEPPAGSRVVYPAEVFTADTSKNEYERSWGVAHIGSESAHQRGITGSGVKIAVIDTGIDFHHEDLDDNYRGGHNFLDENSPPLDDSDNSHGTNVAGIIAAEKNGIGIVGVAPEASLYSLKVLDGQGSGLIADIISALQWSVENGMDIANISIQGGHSEAFEEACRAAEEAGLLIIAAAGNSYGTKAAFPGAYPSVVAVTGTNAYDQSGTFAPLDPEIELSAPGVAIPSTAKNGAYGILSGTSQASPHVAGVAALMMSQAARYPTVPGLKANENVRMKLQMSARDLGAEGKDNIFGYGLVSAELPKTTIDEISCDGNSVTVEGDGFGHYLENDRFATTLSVAATATQCHIESWTTTRVVADCGAEPSGAIKITTLFGHAEKACPPSRPTSIRLKWWVIENWWSSKR